jgi:uncharacterized protein
VSLLRPGVVLPHIWDITPHFMDGHGLRGLLLDLDNTLIPYGSYDERREVTQWARELLAQGYLLHLLSNATRERGRIWAERLGLPGGGLSGKPFQQGYRAALGSMGLRAPQVGMVGDQLFTDVLGGNLAGMFTILVTPIADNALPHTRLARQLERQVLKRYGHDWSGRASLNPNGPGPDAADPIAADPTAAHPTAADRATAVSRATSTSPPGPDADPEPRDPPERP